MALSFVFAHKYSLRISLFVLLVLLLTACGSSGAASSSTSSGGSNGSSAKNVFQAGKITEFPASPTNGHVDTIITGPDGNLWFIANGVIERMTPTGTDTVLSQTSGVHDITRGPDGNVWYVTNGVFRITPGGTITSLQPYGSDEITMGPDHNIWYIDSGNFALARITPTGTATEF